MSLSELKVGDKALITLDVELLDIDDEGDYAFQTTWSKGGKGSFYLAPDSPEIVSVEKKAEPPFKVGNLIEHAGSGSRYLILEALGGTRYRYYSLQYDNAGTFDFSAPEKFTVLASTAVTE